MQVSDLADFVRGLVGSSAGPVARSLVEQLDDFVHIGLGYLSLSRESSTLSGGESQRVKMVRHLGSSLTDLTYIFDEPSVGLHAHDLQRVCSILLRLRDKGNTVLVVEHKPAIIQLADRIVDMGPGAGVEGGTITYQGDVAGLLASNTLTGKHLARTAERKSTVRERRGELQIKHASLHNVKNVSVSIPKGVLTDHRRSGLGQERVDSRLLAAATSGHCCGGSAHHARIAALNLDVIAYADWVIDLGPAAGRDGGRIIFEGTPRELTEQPSLTGRHLAQHLNT